MRIITSIRKGIEFISEYSGRVISWACVALVLVLVYEVIMRHVFDAPTIWVHEVAIMLGGTIVIMGLANTHLHGGHVRIDAIYSQMSPKWKAAIDVFCFLTLLLPLVIVIIYISADRMIFALEMGEKLIETNWYPPSFPIRTVFLLGWFLFALQAFAQFIKDLNFLIKGKTL